MKKSIAFFFLLVGGSTLSMIKDPRPGTLTIPSSEKTFKITSDVQVVTNDNVAFTIPPQIANNFAFFIFFSFQKMVNLT